jgi:hypothetical protein
MMNTPLPLLHAEEVKARADFVAIAGRYTHLSRAGWQFVGLCPFHRERKPSFYVHPEKKTFYCFGCQQGGDIYSFIMLAEGVDFLDALRIVSGVSDGVASGSSPVRSTRERFAAGEGAKPLGLRSKPSVIARPVESRAQVLASLDATNQRLAQIAATNRAALAALATACEPDCGAEAARGTGSFT